MPRVALGSGVCTAGSRSPASNLASLQGTKYNHPNLCLGVVPGDQGCKSTLAFLPCVYFRICLDLCPLCEMDLKLSHQHGRPLPPPWFHSANGWNQGDARGGRWGWEEGVEEEQEGGRQEDCPADRHLLFGSVMCVFAFCSGSQGYKL